MERFTELAIVLKSFPFQDRDRVAVFLTENHGKITGLAKGGIHSRRFGGSLDFLACARVHYVQKPHSEMARLEEATTHHEFTSLHKDFDRLTAASFAAEYCLRLIEPYAPAREMFVTLSNMLFQLDAGMPVLPAVNAFLCKAFKAMGYPPSLLRCVQCGKGAHEVASEGDLFWTSEAGGIVCFACAGGRFRSPIDSGTLLRFHELTVTPFKQLAAADAAAAREPEAELYRVLSDFLHHHIPGVPAGGFKSWTLLNESLGAPLHG